MKKTIEWRSSKDVPPKRTDTLEARRVKEPGWITFGRYLRGLMTASEIESARELAERVAKIEVKRGYVKTSKRGKGRKPMERSIPAKVMVGSIPPPESAITGVRHLKDRVEHHVPWAEAIGLTKHERERFELEAWLARSPRPVQEHVRMLEAKIEALTKRR